MLNDTATLQDHEWSDDLSVTSFDDQPGCLQYAYYRLKYRLCGAPPLVHMPYETTSPRSAGQYHYGHHSRASSWLCEFAQPPLSRGPSANLPAHHALLLRSSPG